MNVMNMIVWPNQKLLLHLILLPYLVKIACVCVVACIIVLMELINMMVLTKPEAATTSNLIAIFGEKCYVNIDHNRRAKKCRSCTTYCMQVCFLHMLMLYIELITWCSSSLPLLIQIQNRMLWLNSYWYIMHANTACHDSEIHLRSSCTISGHVRHTSLFIHTCWYYDTHLAQSQPPFQLHFLYNTKDIIV